MSTEPEVRSGLHTDWTSTLPDLTPDECYDYIAKLAEVPLKTCDGLVGCELPVQYWVQFHGCDSIAVCTGHAEEIVEHVESHIASGASRCQVCGKSFAALDTVMNWRVI